MKALAVPEIPIHRYELACGVRLMVSPRPSAPVCAVQAHVRGGHSLDGPGRQGTASLAGRFVEQGTKHFSEEEIANVLEPAGGSLVGGSTGISAQIAGSEWKTLLELVGSCLVAPTYPADKIAREKQRVLDRLAVEKDDPRSQGTWLFRKLVYGSHWMGRPDYGSLESVRSIERSHVVRHHAANWCGARTVIAVCGDVDPAKVKQVLGRALARYPRGKPLPAANRDFPQPKARTGVFPAKRQQVHVFLGHIGIERRDPDYAALAVMDHVLGTGPGFTSRITRILREELGLAYSVNAAIHTTAGVMPGVFTAYIGTSPENLGTAVTRFQEEIRRIRTELVSKAELELVKSYLTGSFVLGFDRASRRVQSMISAHRNELPDDHMQLLIESFASVTATGVRDAARRHLRPDEACLVAAGPVTRRELRELSDRVVSRRGR